MGKQWKQWQTLFFGGSKITADGDCSHQIKRRLLLGKKVMTNLYSIFKGRDSTLPTKVHLVKAMVFPVVMYGCESWTVKKAERQRIDAFELWCWRTVESPLDCKEIQPVHSEEDQPWDFFGRNDVKAETPVLWPPHEKSWLIGKDSDAGMDWGQEKGTTEDEMVTQHHRLNGHDSEHATGDSGGQRSLLCCSPWNYRVWHNLATEQQQCKALITDVMKLNWYFKAGQEKLNTILCVFVWTSSSLPDVQCAFHCTLTRAPQRWESRLNWKDFFSPLPSDTSSVTS